VALKNARRAAPRQKKTWSALPSLFCFHFSADNQRFVGFSHSEGPRPILPFEGENARRILPP
jgi:hypothetical protein